MEKGSSASVVCCLIKADHSDPLPPSYQEFQPVSDNLNLNLYVFRHLPAGGAAVGTDRR